MKDKPKTPAEWLALPAAERGVALAEVLTEGPWKHEWDTCAQSALNKCQKCGKPWASSSYAIKRNFSCSVPDPIVIDWNTAMAWFRKSHECFGQLREIYFIICQEGVNHSAFPWWLLYNAQPYHYLIAAVMAKERNSK